jgi:hypothetical protein
VLAALQPLGGQCARERAHLVSEIAPGPGLPDPEILLADGGALAALLGVVHQQLGKRVERAAGGIHQGPPP